MYLNQKNPVIYNGDVGDINFKDLFILTRNEFSFFSKFSIKNFNELVKFDIKFLQKHLKDIAGKNSLSYLHKLIHFAHHFGFYFKGEEDEFRRLRGEDSTGNLNIIDLVLFNSLIDYKYNYIIENKRILHNYTGISYDKEKFDYGDFLVYIDNCFYIRSLKYFKEKIIYNKFIFINVYGEEKYNFLINLIEERIKNIMLNDKNNNYCFDRHDFLFAANLNFRGVKTYSDLLNLNVYDLTSTKLKSPSSVKEFYEVLDILGYRVDDKGIIYEDNDDKVNVKK